MGCDAFTSIRYAPSEEWGFLQGRGPGFWRFAERPIFYGGCCFWENPVLSSRCLQSRVVSSAFSRFGKAHSLRQKCLQSLVRFPDVAKPIP
jgi:hypothetical protein